MTPRHKASRSFPSAASGISALALLLLVTVSAWAQGFQGPGVTPSGSNNRVPPVDTLPATCTVGQVVFHTAATIGLYQCLVTDTWTQVAGVGGAGVGDALVANPLSQFASTTSAQLATVISNETGSGLLVFGTAPTITLANGSGLPVSTGISGLGTNIATFLATPTSANFAAAITNETGTGLVVLATSPTLTTPTLGAALVTSLNGLTFPAADGTAGQFLATDGAGAIAFTTPATTLVNDIKFNNGKGIKTNITTNDTLLMQAYDVDGAAYKTFATLTAANTPTFDISAPAGGSLSGNFTTLSVNSIAFPTSAADDTTLVSSGSAWVAAALANCTDTGGNHLNYTASTNAFSCGTSASGGGGSALSGITAAASATNTIASGNNYEQTWNWAVTTAAKQAMIFGETTAATNGSGGATNTQAILSAKTLATSTAVPLLVQNFGVAMSMIVQDVASDTTPFVIDAGGFVGINLGAPTYALDIGSADGTFAMRVTDGSHQYVLFADANKGGWGTNTNSPFSLFTNNGNPHLLLRNSNSGAIDIYKHVNPPTSIGTGATGLDNEYLHIGGDDAVANGYYLIGFGYDSAANSGTAGSAPPAYIGGQEISNTSFTNMDLVFGTRSATTDTAPIERFRITNDGLVKLVGSPLVSTGTVPTLSGGCSTGTQTGGAYAGTFTSSTTGTCAVTMTFAATAPTGYICHATDVTTAVDALFIQTGGTTTTATFSSTTVNGDVIRFSCQAY